MNNIADISLYLHQNQGTMANIDELIKQKCAEYDLTPDVLTPEELEELKREIKAEQRGEIIFDSVLDNPEFQSQRILKEIEEESKHNEQN